MIHLSDCDDRRVLPEVPLRVVVADDVMLIRSGLSRLLRDSGVVVVGEAADADELLHCISVEEPDVAIVDIRMPPTHTDEGLQAARTIREHHQNTSVVVLSQYVEPDYARRLLEDGHGGVGYLLKERVSDIDVLIDAMHRVRKGEYVIDPHVSEVLLARRAADSRLTQLTARERDVLTLVAEGRSNAAIADQLFLSERTVESVCASVFRKLGLESSRDDNRRVLAVLQFLRA